jgi:carbohydrate binding protein with CBM11 domain
VTRWRRRALVGLASLAAVYAVRVALWRPYAVTGDAPAGPRAVGVVHVHTTLSDGGGTPEDVARAARAAGLQFVVLTDHNTLDAKPFEGYRDGVLVIVGTEISTTAGHLVGLGIPDPVYRFSGDAEDALDDVRTLGGSAYAAHPLSPRDDFRWTGWDLPGPWGMELVNGDSQWRAAGWGRLLRTAALYPLNARYALLGSVTPPRETLARWDALMAQRHVTGIAGADAHNRVALSKRFAPRFPSYESVFALARNHVLLDAPLTGEAAADTRAILEALRRGRAYVGLDALAPADGFAFEATDGSRRAAMGETVAPSPALRMRAGGRMPEGARVVILRDGKPLAEGVGAAEAVADVAGVYRAEAYVSGWDVPWILSNPIEVFDATAAAARESRAAWPSPAPVPAAVQTLDAFEGRTGFEPGFDTSSTQNKDVIDPHAGADGGGAARIAFTLGVPTDGHPDVFNALVDRTPRDLTGKQGLILSLKADGVYRLWIQVRDANPASKDEQTEWWFASLRTSTEWQRLAVPFARLRSINPATDGKLDLDKVKALVFVLDKGSVKPGTTGTIRIDEVGAY